MGEFTLNAGPEFTPLSDLLRHADVNISMPCAGNHTCGKCRVVVKGEASGMNAAEAGFLSEEEIHAGVRLACFTKVRGSVGITLPETGFGRILTEGVANFAPESPMMGPGEYGAAIDIGTTTVVCYLFDSGGNLLGAQSEMNRQRSFGADVISRIQHCIENGPEAIHKLILQQLEDMLLALAGKANVGRDKITAAVVTGNTTMLHLFAGLNPRRMGCLPFTPESLFDCERDDLLRGITAYVPACISAYVGADLLCCVLSSEMVEKGGTSCIVDIGTNGEMALFTEGALSCCSTAAGPAFEGAGISCGMMAGEGAIAHIHPKGDGYVYETIGGAPPKGVCGSGVVDTVDALLATGALTESGRYNEEHRDVETAENGSDAAFVYPGTDIRFTQDDVRQLQLAKAAIYGGMETLLNHEQISFDKLDVLYICGGFGSYLDLHSAEGIGLIPKGIGDKTAVLGNGAAAGAARILLSQKEREKLRTLAEQCRYIELSGNEEFMEYYVDAMSF